MELTIITQAYRQLSEARAQLDSASEAVISAKIMLEGALARATLSGEIVGKNEAERQAKTCEMFAEQVSKIEAFQTIERASKLNFDLAQLEVDRVRLIVRAETNALGATIAF
jgi:hypothetical protein